MKHCLTCKYWQNSKSAVRYGSITNPPDPATYVECKTEEETKKKWGFLVRCCEHPKVVFYERPEINGAAVVDGSNFSATLLTAEGFGCVLHEDKSNEEHTNS